MRLTDIIRTALRSLAAHPMRTALTSLGIALGAATTTVVIIMGHGARDLLDERLESAGKNLIIIRPGTFTPDGFIQKAALTRDDAQRLRKDAELTQLTTGVAEAQAILETVRAGKNQAYTTIDGVHSDAFKLRAWELAEGRFLTRQDDVMLAPVCVLGNTVRQALFPGKSNNSIIGQKITFRSMNLTVVGVLLPKGKDPLGLDHDDEVFVPLSLCQVRLARTTDLTIMIAVARRAEDISPASTRIRQLLRDQHRLKTDDLDDCTISTVQEMAALGLFTLSTMNLLTTCLAGAGLLIGVIGVMATLLVTMGEQLREIGLRTCIGALPRDIRNQLMMEATLITVGGGVVGITAGLALAQGLTHALDWPFSVSLVYPLAGLIILIVVGILSGVYPAFRASRMNPIQALHTE